LGAWFHLLHQEPWHELHVAWSSFATLSPPSLTTSPWIQRNRANLHSLSILCLTVTSSCMCWRLQSIWTSILTLEITPYDTSCHFLFWNPLRPHRGLWRFLTWTLAQSLLHFHHLMEA
jgi:hypothetical protein